MEIQELLTSFVLDEILNVTRLSWLNSARQILAHTLLILSRHFSTISGITSRTKIHKEWKWGKFKIFRIFAPETELEQEHRQ